MRIVVKKDPVYRRRRAVALLLLLLVVGLVMLLVVLGSRTVRAAAGAGTPHRADLAAAQGAPVPTADATSRAVPAPTGSSAAPPPRAQTRLVERRRWTGPITPRRVAASSRGLVVAANMMYTHTVTAYDATGRLVATVPDAVTLPGGPARGAPVDAAFTPDGAHVYVSNYAMSGPGFGPEPSDRCRTDRSAPGSYLYRIDAARHRIDQVVPVGAVPKELVVTPDAATVAVANWCGGDVSLVDTATARERGRVPVGDHPRGLATSRDGRTLYVLTGALGGAATVSAVDLGSRRVVRVGAAGPDARDLAVGPDGGLVVVCVGDASVRHLDPATGRVRRQTRVAADPRAVVVSRDGATAYVASYRSARLTALRTHDLTVRSTARTPPSPSGLAVEPTRGAVWVAGYAGTIAVFDEVPVAPRLGG